MKYPLTLLSIAALVAGGSVSAQEINHLEFARGLRARHYSDLALEYLEKHQKTAPPDQQSAFAFEIAQTRVDIARDEPNASKRLTLYEKARRELEDFQLRHANTPFGNGA